MTNTRNRQRICIVVSGFMTVGGGGGDAQVINRSHCSQNVGSVSSALRLSLSSPGLDG